MVSISSTFYSRLFLYKSALQSFSLVTIWLCNFWHKHISAKAAHKMLVKLTNVVYDLFSFNNISLKLNMNTQIFIELITNKMCFRAQCWVNPIQIRFRPNLLSGSNEDPESHHPCHPSSARQPRQPRPTRSSKTASRRCCCLRPRGPPSRRGTATFPVTAPPSSGGKTLISLHTEAKLKGQTNIKMSS